MGLNDTISGHLKELLREKRKTLPEDRCSVRSYGVYFEDDTSGHGVSNYGFIREEL